MYELFITINGKSVWCGRLPAQQAVKWLANNKEYGHAV